jgi:hypothetical protein
MVNCWFGAFTHSIPCCSEALFAHLCTDTVWIAERCYNGVTMASTVTRALIVALDSFVRTAKFLIREAGLMLVVSLHSFVETCPSNVYFRCRKLWRRGRNQESFFKVLQEWVMGQPLSSNLMCSGVDCTNIQKAPFLRGSLLHLCHLRSV